MSIRGYCGIGIYHWQKGVNVGTLWRSARCFDADFLFTIGQVYREQPGDTMKAPRHMPLWAFTDWEHFRGHVPTGCQVVAVELTEDQRNALIQQSHALKNKMRRG